MLLMITALCAASPFENAAKNIKNSPLIRELKRT